MSVRNGFFRSGSIASKSYDRTIQSGPNPTWTRPSDWLALPDVAATESKFVGLLAIPRYNTGIGFTVNGNYTVDWGDGTAPVNYSSGATAYRFFYFDSISNSTLTSKDYKQVLITVTMQVGQSFTGLNLSQAPFDLSTGFNYAPAFWLDMVISGPNLTSLLIASSNAFSLSRLNHFPFLERVRILSNSVTNFQNTFYKMASLKVVHLSSNSCTNFYACFYDCRSLILVEGLNCRLATNIGSMFYQCTSLVDAPIIVTSNSLTDTTYMFYFCTSLKKVYPFDVSNANINATQMFFLCSSLETTPGFVFNQTTGTPNLTQMFSGCSALRSISPGFIVKGATTFTSTFSSCPKLEYVPPMDFSRATTLATMFNGCTSLKVVPDFPTTSNVGDFSSMLSGCYSLLEGPSMNVMSCTNFSSVFSSCYSMIRIRGGQNAFTSAGNTPFDKCTTFNSLFNECGSLVESPTFMANACTTATSMYSNAKTLQKIGPHKFPLLSTLSSFAYGVDGLMDLDMEVSQDSLTLGTIGSSYVFSSGTNPGGTLSNITFRNIETSISFACTSLRLETSNNLFQNLGVPRFASNTITVSSTPLSANTLRGPIVTTTATRTAGSKILTSPGTTTGIIPGMSVTGANLGYLTRRTCFLDEANSTITLENHQITPNSNSPILLTELAHGVSVSPFVWANTILSASGNASPLNYTHLARGNGIFMAVANRSNVCVTSPDGITWSRSFLPEQTTWSEVAYGNNIWVAVAIRAGLSDVGTGAGTNAAAYSVDNGITWTSTRMPSNTDWCSVTYGKSRDGTDKWVAIPGRTTTSTYNTIAYSNNGINWTTATLPTSRQLVRVKYLRNRFFIICGWASTTGTVFYSDDAINWNQSFPSNITAVDITYDPQYDILYLMAGGFTAGATLLRSINGGLTWQTVSGFSTSIVGTRGWTTVKYGGGFLVTKSGSPSSGDTFWSMWTHGLRARTRRAYIDGHSWPGAYGLTIPSGNTPGFQCPMEYDEINDRFVLIGGGVWTAGTGQAYGTGNNTSNNVFHLNVAPVLPNVPQNYVFYARDITDNTFRLSITPGGNVYNISAVTGTSRSNVRQMLNVGTVVVSVNSGANITLSYPADSSAASVSTVFKANSMLVMAAMKNWTITI